MTCQFQVCWTAQWFEDAHVPTCLSTCACSSHSKRAACRCALVLQGTTHTAQAEPATCHPHARRWQRLAVHATGQEQQCAAASQHTARAAVSSRRGSLSCMFSGPASRARSSAARQRAQHGVEPLCHADAGAPGTGNAVRSIPPDVCSEAHGTAAPLLPRQQVRRILQPTAASVRQCSMHAERSVAQSRPATLLPARPAPAAR